MTQTELRLISWALEPTSTTSILQSGAQYHSQLWVGLGTEYPQLTNRCPFLATCILPGPGSCSAFLGIREGSSSSCHRASTVPSGLGEGCPRTAPQLHTDAQGDDGKFLLGSCRSSHTMKDPEGFTPALDCPLGLAFLGQLGAKVFCGVWLT